MHELENIGICMDYQWIIQGHTYAIPNIFLLSFTGFPADYKRRENETKIYNFKTLKWKIVHIVATSESKNGNIIQ